MAGIANVDAGVGDCAARQVDDASFHVQGSREGEPETRFSLASKERVQNDLVAPIQVKFVLTRLEPQEASLARGIRAPFGARELVRSAADVDADVLDGSLRPGGEDLDGQLVIRFVIRSRAQASQVRSRRAPSWRGCRRSHGGRRALRSPRRFRLDTNGIDERPMIGSPPDGESQGDGHGGHDEGELHGQDPSEDRGLAGRGRGDGCHATGFGENLFANRLEPAGR